MLIQNQHPLNKSLTVSLLGRPNAGKSTLVNKLLGFDLSIVSPKPQTTRNHFKCVLNIGRSEIILLDTPGVHLSNQELNKRMNHEALKANEKGDLNFIIVDLSLKRIEKEWELFVKGVSGNQFLPSFILFNKYDSSLLNDLEIKQFFDEKQKQHPELNLQSYMSISAKDGHNINDLKDFLVNQSYSSPHYFDDGSVSNKSIRFFVSEYIREQAFDLLAEELPYETAVMIESFDELPPQSSHSQLTAKINASIIVNRPSQKGIVVGSKGSMIKAIGSGARKKIEALLGGKVLLNLHVKVSTRWFNNNRVLEELGLERTPHSTRVWRQR
jgi:GTP-binding protein Era